MEQMLADIFEQARKIVAEADRKLAEEEERKHAAERESRLLELSSQIETAFDFTSKEKLELDPRLDLQEDKAVMEFVVRSLRAIFALEPQEDGLWALTVADDGHAPEKLGEFRGGVRTDAGSRRLAAARIVTAIGNWAQKISPVAKTGAKRIQPRWQDQAAPSEKREPTYGTFGKFLGY